MLGEEGPELGCRGLGIRLGPEGGEARDVRGRHAGAGEAAAAERHGEGREDVDSGAGEVDLAAARPLGSGLRSTVYGRVFVARASRLAEQLFPEVQHAFAGRQDPEGSEVELRPPRRDEGAHVAKVL